MKAEMISFYTKCRTDPRYVQAIQQIETTLDDPKVQQAVKDALHKQGNSQEGGYVAYALSELQKSHIGCDFFRNAPTLQANPRVRSIGT